jgi:nuclear pore complex protein Nup98-Nup96
LDKSTREPILDPADPRVDAFITKLETMPETSFIGFNSNTGAWKFRVEHFSRYGLDDDEAQVEVAPAATRADSSKDTSIMDDSFAHLTSRRGPAARQQRVTDLNDILLDDDEVELYEDNYSEEDGVVAGGEDLLDYEDDEEILLQNEQDDDDDDYVEKVEEKVETFLMPEEGSDFGDVVIRDEFEDDEMNFAPPTPPQTASLSETAPVGRTPMKQLNSARRVASMKGTATSPNFLGVFFPDESSSAVKKSHELDQFDESTPAPLQDDNVAVSPVGAKRSRGWSPESSRHHPELKKKASTANFLAPESPPCAKYQSEFVKAKKFDVGCVEPLDAALYGRPACDLFVDASLALGRSFRVGWSPNGEIITMRRYFVGF